MAATTGTQKQLIVGCLLELSGLIDYPLPQRVGTVFSHAIRTKPAFSYHGKSWRGETVWNSPTGVKMGFKTNFLAGIAGAFDPRAEQAVRKVAAEFGGHGNAYSSGAPQPAPGLPHQHQCSPQNQSQRFNRMHNIASQPPHTSRPFNDAGTHPVGNGHANGSGWQTGLLPNYMEMRNEAPGVYTPPADLGPRYNRPAPPHRSSATADTVRPRTGLPPNYMEMRNEAPGVYTPPADMGSRYNRPAPPHQSSVTTDTIPPRTGLPPNYMEMRNEGSAVYIPPTNLAQPSGGTATPHQSGVTANTVPPRTGLPSNYMEMRNGG